MYYSFSDLQFWLFGLLSFFSLIISCYFPGWHIVSKLNLSSKSIETSLSIIVGLVMWAFQAVIFGYLHIRFATFIYLAVGMIFAWKYRKSIIASLKTTWEEIRNAPKVIWFSAIVAVVLQLYAHIGSGLLDTNSVVFYFVNSVDGVMHLSYIQSMAQHFPPIEPGFASKPLENYHYWGDLVLSEFYRVWNIPVIHLFFHYFPTFLLLLTTVLLIQVIRMLKGTTTTVVLALFLFTFGSDAAFLIAQYLHGNWGASIASLDTGVSFIFNMPQVFSRLVFIAILALLLHWKRSKQQGVLLVVSMLGASLFGFKVYYGIYFLMGMGFFSVFILCQELFKPRWTLKDIPNKIWKFIQQYRDLIFCWLLLLVLSSAIFFPTNSNTGGLFLEPLAWTKKLLSADNFNYQEWFLRMQVYEETNNIKSITVYNILAIAITLLSIYGVRFLGILPFAKIKKPLPIELLFFVIPANIIFIVIGFLFLQTTGGFNIYNFLITPIVTMNIIAAFNISLIKNNFVKILLVALVICLSLPRTVLQLKEYTDKYTQRKPDILVSNQELELLNHLRTLPEGVVQSDTKNSYSKLTPYISFFSNHETYLGGVDLLKMNNQQIEERERELQNMFNSQSADELSSNMKSLGISYLYLTTESEVDRFINLSTNTSAITIEKQNSAGMILSVN